MNLAALLSPSFRLYLGGNIFALNGLWMQRVTIGWLAWDMTASASFVGLVAFINFAPAMIFGPFFGVLVDRVRVKYASLTTQSLLFLLALALFSSFTLGVLTPTILVVLSLLSGLIFAADNPVRMSMVPRLVEKERVVSVITFMAINFHLARLTGPALGGWIIAIWGISASLLVQVLCYLPLLTALLFIRLRPRSGSKIQPERFLQSLLVGVRYVRQSHLIRQAMLVTALFALVIRGTLEILPVIADGIFNMGPTGLGLLTSAAGFGALSAALSKALLPAQTKGKLPRVAIICALIGIALVPAVGASRTWELTLALVVILGFCASMAGVSMQTAIQIDLDDDIRGRVMSLWVMVGMGGSALGAITLGALSDIAGFGLTLGAAGAISFTILTTFLIVRR